MKLEDSAYNALNRVSEQTKQDWFYLETDRSGNDRVRDLENDTTMPVGKAVRELMSGVVDLNDLELDKDERAALLDLLRHYGIPAPVGDGRIPFHRRAKLFDELVSHIAWCAGDSEVLRLTLHAIGLTEAETNHILAEWYGEV